MRIQTADITEVITAFHSSVAAKKTVEDSDFTYVPKPQKNKINKLSQAYFDNLSLSETKSGRIGDASRDLLPLNALDFG